MQSFFFWYVTALPLYLFASPGDRDGSRSHAEIHARDAASVRLAVRLHEGDESALSEIIRSYHAPLAAFVKRMLRDDSADVDDVLQVVFFRLWQNRGEIGSETSLRAYLFTAARNHALNTIRSQKRARDHRELEDDSAIVPAVDEALDANDLADAVTQAIGRLPPRCQEIFLLSRDAGMSYSEISKVTGVSVNTVKTQMSRALSALMRAAAPFLVWICSTVSPDSKIPVSSSIDLWTLSPISLRSTPNSSLEFSRVTVHRKSGST